MAVTVFRDGILFNRGPFRPYADAPTRALDFGAGPGTFVWAAKAVWPTLSHATLVEPSVPMTDVAK